MLEARPYQIEGRDAILNEYRRGIRSTLALLPTGTGKTVLFALTADAVQQRLAEAGRPNKTLVLAHRAELLDQAAEKFSEWVPHLSVDIEQGDRRVARHALPDVLVASVQSLSQPKRLAEFDASQFGFVITDESHHATSSSYQVIYRAFPHCLKLFVTATPDRTDGTPLGTICESVGFAYDIRNAIEQGYLVPVFREEIIVEGLDLGRLASATSADFSDEDLEDAFIRDAAILQVADVTVRMSLDNGEDRPTLVFCPGVAHAEKMAEAINALRPASAAAIHGKTQSRDQILRRFREGQTHYLCSMGVLNEGVDLPLASLMSNCRPSRSRLLYSQQVGRILRLHPGKTDAKVIDFTDASRRHDLVSVMDIFDGVTQDLQVKERAQSIAKRKKIDALSALKEATEEIGRERQLALVKQIAGRTAFSRVQLSTFAILGIQPRPGRYLGQAITPEQAARLDRHKIPVTGLDRGMAEQVIDSIQRRARAGLSTPRQAKILMRYGLDPDVPFQIASEVIDYIANKEWSISATDRQILRRMAGSVAA